MELGSENIRAKNLISLLSDKISEKDVKSSHVIIKNNSVKWQFVDEKIKTEYKKLKDKINN